MVPNLIEATNQYWYKLNQLEAAYKRGDVSLEEVDRQVKELMAELGRERRATVEFLLSSISRVWNEQREVVIGLGAIALLTYTWVVIS